MARMRRIGRIERPGETLAALAQFVPFVFSGNRLRFLMVPLALLAFIVYLPPYAGSFIGDDYVQLDRISDLLSRPWAAYELLDPFRQSWYYRPLQNLWFLANRLLFGLNPFPFYYLQISVHVLVVAMLYRVARQLRVASAPALAVALLFAFHGHFFDVVTWLSSIAVLLVTLSSLAAVSAFLSYLARPQKAWLLPVTILFVFLALLSHEEGFLVVPFLLLLSLAACPVPPRHREGKHLVMSPRDQLATTAGRHLIAAFLAMFLLVAAYLALQLVRPNLNVALSQTGLSHWSRYLSPAEFSQFLVQALVRATTPFGAQDILQANAYATGSLLLLGLGYGFWRGGVVARLGLVWLALHLGFIYWALWSYQPQFFAGRHLYNGLIGLHLALGALLQHFLPRSPTAWPKARQAVAGGALVMLLFLNVGAITKMHADWLEMSLRDQEVRQQMQQVMPHVSGQTHVFAHAFVTDASYLPATVQVWYDQPLSEPGGSLSRLVEHGRATRHFYLFDYQDGRLTNLMPELQEHEQTIFIWNQEPVREVVWPDGQRRSLESTGRPSLVIAGPADERRLALLTPLAPEVREGWLSLGYTLPVPDQSQLRLAVRRPAQPGKVAYRVWLTAANGRSQILFEETWEDDESTAAAGWRHGVVPLDAYWEQTVTLAFEVQDNDRLIGGGYWANLSFVVDE
jgi:hypothetical protein